MQSDDLLAADQDLLHSAADAAALEAHSDQLQQCLEQEYYSSAAIMLSAAFEDMVADAMIEHLEEEVDDELAAELASYRIEALEDSADSFHRLLEDAESYNVLSGETCALLDDLRDERNEYVHGSAVERNAAIATVDLEAVLDRYPDPEMQSFNRNEKHQGTRRGRTGRVPATGRRPHRCTA